jgi:hypothetical protein
VIKSEHGRVFGGYTSLVWDDTKGMQWADDKAFIFSLTNKTYHDQWKNKDQII